MYLLQSITIQNTVHGGIGDTTAFWESHRCPLLEIAAGMAYPQSDGDHRLFEILLGTPVWPLSYE